MLLVMALCLTGCGKSVKVPALKEQSETAFVEYQVVKQDMKNMQYVTGTVKAKQYEHKFVKSGIVDYFAVKSGDKVVKGQFLGRLVDKEEKEAVAQAKADLAFHNTQVINERKQQELAIQIQELEIRELQRKETNMGVIQDAKLVLEELKENLRYQDEQADMQRRSDEKALSKAEKSLQENYLYASHSGTVSFTLSWFHLAQVNANQTAVAIASEDECEIALEKPILASDLDKIKGVIGYVNGNPVEVGYEFETQLDAGKFVDRALFHILGDTKNLSGYDVIIGIVKERIRKATVVPDQAINRGIDGAYVYLKKGSKKVRTSVEIGRSINGFTQITSGVKAGQTVFSYEGVRLLGNTKEEKVTKGNLRKKISLEHFWKIRSLLYAGNYVGEDAVLEKIRGENQNLIKKGDLVYQIRRPDVGNKTYQPKM